MMKVKMKFNVLRVSAGKIEDNNMLFANAICLDESIADVIEPNRIDVGQKQAKVSIDTSMNNQLAKDIALSGLLPGELTCEVITNVKGQVMSMQIVGFEAPHKKQL